MSAIDNRITEIELTIKELWSDWHMVKGKDRKRAVAREVYLWKDEITKLDKLKKLNWKR